MTVNTETPTLCYFFFKDGTDRIDGAKALCAFLHQLFMQQPCLYRYAENDFRCKGEVFLKDFGALWDICLRATENASSHEVICVLDALDECNASSRAALIAKLVQLFDNRGSSDKRKPIIKFLVTSRPEFTTIRQFQALTHVRLRGAEESEQISREIDLVIRDKVSKLGPAMGLNHTDESNLLENLCNIPHRTYLWLHLTFNDIETKSILTKNEIAVIARNIPKTVDQAYNRILDKSSDRRRARKLLHIVLAARRPLTLLEINVAMVIEDHHQNYGDLDSWRTDACEDRIKNICGLFVTVIDSKVYLIHQTAREFLVGEEGTYSSLAHEPLDHWKFSFHPSLSNLLLAQICIRYLQLLDVQLLLSVPKEDRPSENPVSHFYYAAHHWPTHFTQAKDLPDSALIKIVAFRICDTSSETFELWFKNYPDVDFTWECMGKETDVLVESYFGHASVVELLLRSKDAQAGSKTYEGRTPLWWAAYNGYVRVVNLLLEWEDVDLNIVDYRNSPLRAAVRQGHGEVVRQLLGRKNFPVFWTDTDGQTLLYEAIAGRHEEIVKLLLEREDVPVCSKDKYGGTALSLAAQLGYKTIVELLLVRDNTQVNEKDNEGETPLSWAVKRNHQSIVQLLEQHLHKESRPSL